ncbi:hypothetical protein DKL61_08160 [Gammaproteobacteria bacterium ESL0073]|nr:hypothetical protein DKL61_08160 [Gammaproteobacteria bacterium ESL0073]
MAKFYKYNDQMDAQVGWHITDPNRIAWRKRGLQDGGKDLAFRKFMFYFFLGGLLLTYFFMAIFLNDIIPITCASVVMIGLFGSLFYVGILGGDVFTYRLTDTHAELAKWNDNIPLAKKIIQIPLWILGVAIVFMVATKPEIIFGVGLGGMVGVGLLAGATVYSSDYEKDNVKYRHFFTDWSLMVQHVEIDKERRTVVFWATDLNTKTKKPFFAPFCLFCTKDNFEQISEFVINKGKAKQLEVKYKAVFTN